MRGCRLSRILVFLLNEAFHDAPHAFLQCIDQISADLFRFPIVRRLSLAVESGTEGGLRESHSFLSLETLQLSLDN